MTTNIFDLFKVIKKTRFKTNRTEFKGLLRVKKYNYSESELESDSNSASINSGIFIIFFILYSHSYE